MTAQQAQQELQQLRLNLSVPHCGSSHQRKIWRKRAAFLNRGLKQINHTAPRPSLVERGRCAA